MWPPDRERGPPFLRNHATHLATKWAAKLQPSGRSPATKQGEESAGQVALYHPHIGGPLRAAIDTGPSLSLFHGIRTRIDQAAPQVLPEADL